MVAVRFKSPIDSLFRLDAYLRHSRNLKRIDEPRRRFQLLHQGKADVIAFLSKLPATSHEWTSLVVDVPICSVRVGVLLVVGLTLVVS